MKIKAKLILILILCITATACSTTKELNRSLVQQEKIKTINLNTLDENISIEKSDSGLVTGAVIGGVVGGVIGNAIDSNTNTKRKKGFVSIQENINNIDANAVFKNALQHNLVGTAFSEDLIIDTAFDQSIKKPYLIPILKPSITMASNYSSFEVGLKVSTTQDNNKKYKSKYSSQKLANTAELEPTKEQNKQFWLANPLILKEKLVDALYDVAKQFADDFNAQ